MDSTVVAWFFDALTLCFENKNEDEIEVLIEIEVMTKTKTKTKTRTKTYISKSSTVGIQRWPTGHEKRGKALWESLL